MYVRIYVSWNVKMSAQLSDRISEYMSDKMPRIYARISVKCQNTGQLEYQIIRIGARQNVRTMLGIGVR
jgi:hypothetical protein